MPVLPSRLLVHWRAFIYLHKKRNRGESGPLPISQTEINAYLATKPKLDYDQLQRLLKIIETLDETYLSHYAERLESERQKRKAQRG